VSETLDDIARAQRVWSETRARPETAAVGDVAERRVQTSIEALDNAAASLQPWRERILALSDPLVDRRAAISEALERLQAAASAALTNLLVPGRPPVWQSGLGTQLQSELPHVPEEIRSYATGTLAYVEHDLRPLVVQALLAALLMFAFHRLSTRAREREDHAADTLPAASRIECPYAVGLLLVLLVSPALHPLAPQRFRQLLAMIALFPAARILIHTTGRANLTGFAGLLSLLLADWIGLALAALPAVARVALLLTLTFALGLALWFARGTRNAGNTPWAHRAATLAVIGLALALLAEIGGWTNLGRLLSRSIIGGTALAVYLYAAVIGLEPVVVYGLRSSALRRSHLFERSTAGLQRQVGRWMRSLAAILWLYLLLPGVGLSHTGAEALRALLHAGVSVGALSLTIGDVLAFIATLLAAMLLARVVTGLLEEDVYPRTSLPRGVPFVLSTFARYAVYSLGFLLALAAAGVQLSQLTILLGGLGVGVGLGLQDVVKNFAAGLTVLLERRVHVGDALQIQSQEIFGRVLSIGLRATIVRSWNGSEVVVPNADLVSGAITNWTLSDRLCRIEVLVGVAYGTDPEHVVALLLDTARSVDQLLAEPPPQALFKGFGESSLDFALRAWTDEGYEQTGSLTSALALAVHRSLRDAGIGVPFPQRDVHLASVAPAVRDELSRLWRKE